MKIPGCPVIRLNMCNDIMDDWEVTGKLKRFTGFEIINTPAIQVGNFRHFIVRIAREFSRNTAKLYSTYRPIYSGTMDSQEVVFIPEEHKLKKTSEHLYHRV